MKRAACSASSKRFFHAFSLRGPIVPGDYYLIPSAEWRRSGTTPHGSDARRWLETVSARVTSLMDFNIDRGSMLKLCHERILDCAPWKVEKRRARERESERDGSGYYIASNSGRP